MNRVLQVNLENCGGAFQLIYQAQQILKDRVEFDYYTMGVFEKNDTYLNVLKMGSKINEADLRKNRLIGHAMLPFKFYNFLKKNKYSIIHINSDSAWKILIYAFPAKLLKINKIIIHSHSSEINGDHIKLKKICHYIAKKAISYLGTDFCGCSYESVKWMYGEKMKNKNIEIINNGVNTEKFKFNQKLRDELRKKFNVEDKIVMGTVGNFSYQKNPEFLIEIIDKMKREKHKDYVLLFVGEGLDQIKVKKMVQDKGLKNHVIFYGKTNNVNEVLNMFDIFVLPSRFEGLPVSGIEAQTNGLISIFSSKITHEVEISNKCYYLDIDNSIMEWCNTIKNVNLNYNRKDCFKNTVMKNFDISYTANQLEKIYSL